MILLDAMLRRMNEFGACRRLSSALLLCSRRAGQEEDKVVRLEWRADDYATKPFGVKELLARVRLQLWRAAKP